jgi:hypothetical protein
LQPEAATDEHLFDSWFDPIERVVRDRVRCFIEELIEGELAAVLARPRYGRERRTLMASRTPPAWPAIVRLL